MNKQGLGTQLSHLLELLDGAVQDAYVKAGLATRPRFTPVFRALAVRQPLTIGEIAELAGITQPAATQAVGMMVAEGLVTSTVGANDGRQRLVRLSRKGANLLPKLQQCWAATTLAADGLDAELRHPLSEVLREAIEALQRKPFAERIAEARERLAESPRSRRSSP